MSEKEGGGVRGKGGHLTGHHFVLVDQLNNRKIKASEMLVAPRISEYFLKSLKFLKN